MSESLGQIIRLQVHAESLKRDSVYDPEPLIDVQRGVIDASGIVGWNGRGWILDSHHTAHPRVRADGRRVLSIGFTGHYERMVERFGEVAVGIGGENIVVDGPAVGREDIAEGLVIRTRDGAVIELLNPVPAIACPGFTSHLLRSPSVLPRDEITEHLAFLSTGTRGYILSVDHVDRGVEISVGDEVFKR